MVTTLEGFMGLTMRYGAFYQKNLMSTRVQHIVVDSSQVNWSSLSNSYETLKFQRSGFREAKPR